MILGMRECLGVVQESLWGGGGSDFRFRFRLLLHINFFIARRGRVHAAGSCGGLLDDAQSAFSDFVRGVGACAVDECGLLDVITLASRLSMQLVFAENYWVHLCLLYV